MANPFEIKEPTCISFSGGRTSAYMLWRVLEAHGGKLPEEAVVCFANTGKDNFRAPHGLVFASKGIGGVALQSA